ncbi:hypothetical protein PV327_007074 [Microctonus hyperodae]|uniref:Serine/threonine/tyrosine-interacting protein n=1 Tax=Microctonus hyperodae TaxID=165561 RepID=A0AA39KJ55_MICHY|nr:hypothetical protein PV327_007074 [Microctonus hyperodae]
MLSSSDENNRSLQNMNSSDDTMNETSGFPVFSMDAPKDWTYAMRRSMQEVAPGIFLGPYSSASKSKLESLREKEITHIVCVRQDIEAHFIKPNFPDIFKYLVLDIADTTSENIIQHFKQVKDFIDEGLNSGGKILVHGNAGISRSAALVLAYVMEKYNYSRSEAFAIVQQRRFCVNPNEGFLAQLHEYEPIYQAQRISGKNEDFLTRQNCKRRINQMDTERFDDKTDNMDS